MKSLFKKLDLWCVKENQKRRRDGALSIKPFLLRIVGQTALHLSGVDLHLNRTHDIDAYANFEYIVMRQFETLLKQVGKIYDRYSYQIWMPPETRYETYYKGSLLTVEISKIEYVLISKALKEPIKNKLLLKQYLKKEPDRKSVV